MPHTASPLKAPARLLVVDDDPEVRHLLSDYLGRHELRVSTASDAAQMRLQLREQGFDCLIIDRRLPDADGLALVQELRPTWRKPIILLTGEREEADKVMGLELGADDYITKPFSPRELLARIRTQLRRQDMPPSPVAALPDEGRYRFAGWTLALAERRLIDPLGQQVPLSKGEFSLMRAFCERPMQVLSRDTLLELSRLHGDEVFDRAIDVQILRLRRKIEAQPSQPRLIVTERGSGYCLRTEVQFEGGSLR